MKMRSTGAMLALALLTQAVWADASDDAEAAQRGVPAAQVRAEKATAKEKDKQAQLERQLADLKKQVAELRSKTGDGVGPKESGRDSGSPKPETELKFDGPRVASPMYDDFVNRYLAGDWEKLAKNMTAKEKEIGALPSGNAADLRYIKQAVAECRPEWWDGIKSGKTKSFEQMVWKQLVKAEYQADTVNRFYTPTVDNGTMMHRMAWPAEVMDSGNPLALTKMGFGNVSDAGFREADATGAAIWMMLGAAAVMSNAGPETLANLKAEEKDRMQLFEIFRKSATAAYYGTPTVRRIMLAQSCVAMAFENEGKAEWVGRRPLGAALLIELAAHKDRYVHLRVDPIVVLDANGDGRKAEELLGKPIGQKLLSSKLTLAEDRQLRDIIKGLMEMNSDWRSSNFALTSRLTYDVDREKDLPLAKERFAVIKSAELPRR